MFVRHLGPCAYPSYGDMGQIPVSALWGIVYARWGQRLGQKRVTSENNNICKTKIPEILRFRGFLARREGFEPPAFWSVAAELSSPETLCCHFVSLRKPYICNGFELFSLLD